MCVFRTHKTISIRRAVIKVKYLLGLYSLVELPPQNPRHRQQQTQIPATGTQMASSRPMMKRARTLFPQSFRNSRDCKQGEVKPARETVNGLCTMVMQMKDKVENYTW